MRTVSLPDSHLETSVCFAVYTSMQATLQLYRELLAPWGLTFQQALVLTILWEHEKVTPGDLAQALRLDSSSISGLLGRMEKAGFVRRENSLDDRRAVHVTATARSLEVRQQLAPLAGCIAAAIDLDAEAAETLISTLHGLRDSVGSYDTAAAVAAFATPAGAFAGTPATRPPERP